MAAMFRAFKMVGGMQHAAASKPSARRRNCAIDDTVDDTVRSPGRCCVTGPRVQAPRCRLLLSARSVGALNPALMMVAPAGLQQSIDVGRIAFVGALYALSAPRSARSAQRAPSARAQSLVSARGKRSRPGMHAPNSPQRQASCVCACDLSPCAPTWLTTRPSSSRCSLAKIPSTSCWDAANHVKPWREEMGGA